MSRRLLLLIASVTLGLGSVGATAAQAESTPPPAEPPATTQADHYWACVAVDGVGGACVGNPYP